MREEDSHGSEQTTERLAESAELREKLNSLVQSAARSRQEEDPELERILTEFRGNTPKNTEENTQSSPAKTEEQNAEITDSPDKTDTEEPETEQAKAGAASAAVPEKKRKIRKAKQKPKPKSREEEKPKETKAEEDTSWAAPPASEEPDFMEGEWPDVDWNPWQDAAKIAGRVLDKAKSNPLGMKLSQKLGKKRKSVQKAAKKPESVEKPQAEAVTAAENKPEPEAVPKAEALTEAETAAETENKAKAENVSEPKNAAEVQKGTQTEAEIKADAKTDTEIKAEAQNVPKTETKPEKKKNQKPKGKPKSDARKADESEKEGTETHAPGVLETPEPDFDPEPERKAKPKAAAAKKKPKPVSQSETKHKSEFTEVYGEKSGAPGVLETPEPDFEPEPTVTVSTPEGRVVRVPQYKTLWWEDLAERWRVFLHKVPKAVWAFLVAYLIQPEVGKTTEYSDEVQSLREMPPREAVKKLQKVLSYYRWRTVTVLVLALLAGYITTAPVLGLPLPFFISYIKYPFAYLFLLCAIQIGAMLLGISYLTDGLRTIVKKKWKAETLIAVACFVNLLYTLQIMAVPRSAGYLPYHMTVLLMLFFGMLTRTQRYGNALHVCKAAVLVRDSSVAVNGIREDGTVYTVYKQNEEEPGSGLEDRVWEEDPAERLMRRYVPLVFLLTLIFAVVASAAGTQGVSFLWCWSALLSAALPAGIMTAFTMPFSVLSEKLTEKGILLGGYRSAEALRDADRVILQESDFFSQDNYGKPDMKIADIKVYSDYTTERVNLYTLTVLQMSECVLYDALTAFLMDIPAELPPMENFEFYETGGIGAFIEGNRVLTGSYQFLSRSGIKIPEEVKRGTGIYVAINMQFAGWYPMRYIPRSTVEQALAGLKRRKLQPVAAVRDFNLTRKMLENRFRLSENAVEYPELPERLALSELRDSEEDEPLAILSLDRTDRYTDAVLYGKRLYRATRFNLIFGLLAAAGGVVLTFLLLFARAASAVTPGNLFGYGAVCFLPTLVSAFGTKRH